MNTLLLTPPTNTGGWDLVLDKSNNLQVATGPYAIAQDVASAVKTFVGECWYNANLGVPYFQFILGKLPSLEFMKTKFINAGLTTPNVASIKCVLIGPTNRNHREVRGQLQITDDGGITSIIETPNAAGVAPWYVSGVDING